MSYTIYHADGTPITVPDNTVDTAYYNANVHGPGVGVGTQLVGRNAINYGAPIAQNFLQMTENFASTAAFMPGDAFAIQGQWWFEKTSSATGAMHLRTSAATTGGASNWKTVVVSDPTTGAITVRGGTAPAVNPSSTQTRDGDIQVIGSAISIYANSAWHATGSTTADGPTPPTAPVIGQLWYDTITNLLKVYTTTGWVEVNTGGAATTSGPTTPTNPVLGELWYNTTTNTLMTYTSTGWVSVITSVATSTAIVSSVQPTSPTNGMLWYNTVAQSLNIYVSPSWTTVSGSGTYTGSTPPSSPSAGMLWFDTTITTLKVYTGTAWTAVNTGGTAPPINSPTAPLNPTLGQLWYDTTTSLLKTWNGTSWKEVYTQGGVTTPLTRIPFNVTNAASFTIPAWKPGTLVLESILVDQPGNIAWGILLKDNGAGQMVTQGQMLPPLVVSPPYASDYVIAGQVAGTCNPATGIISLNTAFFSGSISQWLSTTSTFTLGSLSVKFVNGPYAYSIIPA